MPTQRGRERVQRLPAHPVPIHGALQKAAHVYSMLRVLTIISDPQKHGSFMQKTLSCGAARSTLMAQHRCQVLTQDDKMTQRTIWLGA